MNVSNRTIDEWHHGDMMKDIPLAYSTRAHSKMVKETVIQDFLVDFVLPTLEHHTPDSIQVEQPRICNNGNKVGRPKGKEKKTIRSLHQGQHGKRRGRPAYRGICCICLGDKDIKLHRLACGSMVPHGVCDRLWWACKSENKKCPVCRQPVVYETKSGKKEVVVDSTNDA